MNTKETKKTKQTKNKNRNYKTNKEKWKMRK